VAEKKRTALLGAATREAAEKLATREARSMLRVEKDIVNVMCLVVCEEKKMEMVERKEFFVERCNEGSLLYRSLEVVNDRKRWKDLLQCEKP